MRIATFNLENLGGEKQPAEKVQAQIDALRPQLLRLDADILCFQEVNAKRGSSGVKRGLHAFDRLLETTPYAGYSWIATTSGVKKEFADKHNLVILSRWRITDSQQIKNDLLSGPSYLSVTAEPSVKDAVAVHWDRPLLSVTIELPDGRPLHVINLHLRAPLASYVEGQKSGPFSWKTTSGWAEGFYLASLKRSGQALETRLLIDRIFDRDKDALIMVCGDFNAQIRDTPTRILCCNIEDTGNGALNNRALVPLENSLSQSQRFTLIHNGRKQMLDHMLVSPALLADFDSLEVHNETLGDELIAHTSIQDSPQSYHAPIVAKFKAI